CLKIQKRQLTRNELVALNFIILGISLINPIGIVLLTLRYLYLSMAVVASLHGRGEISSRLWEEVTTAVGR
ncbi:hypothetical protein, partial [Bacteroides xylanisolvens]|uniref:hypothetical protein n=1 Tax=Bacteroides xylanisolvens TaxID=371601 RepID=UPI00196182B9